VSADLAVALANPEPVTLVGTAVAGTATTRRRWRSDLLVALTLYGGSAALLLARIAEHPAFLYNWEAYTTYQVLAFWEQPTWHIFHATEGLMTDSGGSPLIALPAWLAFHVAGVSLGALRVPVALLAALAVPLLGLVGRAFVGRGAALLAALLLAISPVFLLYGRTATLVGLSLVPTLATAWVLLRLLREPERWHWVAAFQVALIAGMYAYAPVRFLWPLGAALLAVEMWLRPAARPALARALLVTVLAPTLVISLASWQNPVLAIGYYYEARGEQLLALTVVPQYYGGYLRLTPAEIAAGGPHEGRVALATRLLAQNTGDYARLLLDHGTQPALTDFWNQHGRLYPWFLAPFLLLGVVQCARRARERLEDRLLLTLLFGFGLPMLLTSRVHIGRLIFTLPFMCLLIAAGLFCAVNWLAARAPSLRARPAARVALPAGVALLLLLATARATWAEYHLNPPLPPNADVTPLLYAGAARLPPTGSAALVYDSGSQTDATAMEIEQVQVAPYQLALHNQYRFVNLSGKSAPVDDPADPRPALYYGGVLDELTRTGTLPHFCTTTYYVAPEAEVRFAALVRQHVAACPTPVHEVALP
jgi:4-amino-4-deoxy-L-arabinose transferase-like glycosyltransferase